MCNAHNHPPGCNCGWGGGYRYSSYRYTASHHEHAAPWQHRSWGRPPSYVNPNACCPVCGKCVFYYESPYGGRVFFDELGPPWPKHPCTDGSYYEPVPYEAGSDVEVKAPKWALRGWRPVKILSCTAKEAALTERGKDRVYFSELSVEVKGAVFNLYVTDLKFYEHIYEELGEQLCHGSTVDAQIYELSFFDVDDEEYCVRAYSSLSEAKRAYDKSRVMPKRRLSRNEATAMAKAFVKAFRK